jgi:predicted GTPase
VRADAGRLAALATLEGVLGPRAEIARLRARAEAPGAVPLAVMGRRGAGKSSVLNALCGAERAAVGHVRDTTREASAWAVPRLPEVLWIDAPGLRGAAGHAVEAALTPWDPGATLLVVGATEVETGAEDLARVVRFVRARPRGCEGVVVAVNRVDELDPVDVTDPPFRHPRKSLHIAEACARARRSLARVGVDASEVVPVSALMVWSGGVLAHDGRWNLDALVAALRSCVAAVPEDHAARGWSADLSSLLEGIARGRAPLHAGDEAAMRAAVEVLLGRAVPETGWVARRLWGREGAWLRAAQRAQRDGA